MQTGCLHIGLLYCKVVLLQRFIVVVRMLGMVKWIRRGGINRRDHVHLGALCVLNICSPGPPDANNSENCSE
jgi:hypothetical protein